LAGLGIGEDNAVYRKFFEEQETLFTWARKEFQTERNGGYYFINIRIC
jgi:hypothetical protein